MRLDRLISLGIVNPLRRSFGAFSNPGQVLPVLMYHSISDDPEPAYSPYYKVCTSPLRFGEHMQWIQDAGWRAVTLSEGLAALNGNGEISPKNVAITFDDGFRDFHTAAFPVLRKHGFTASMYLPTAFIGDDRQSFKSRECLTWTEVRELAAAGMEFGSHTVNHPKLVDLSWADIEKELSESRRMIEQQLGAPARSFAYPYAFPQENGRFTSILTPLLGKLGYAHCATTLIGRVRAGDDPFTIRRLPANSHDDRKLLLAKLEGAYDWLSKPQSVIKKLKA